MSLDLLCMGRAAVDLYAEQIGASLKNVDTFAKYVGGCPANIAIGGARLGLKTGMLSRVGDESMGSFVKDTLHKEGVDVSTLKVDPSRLTALVLLGIDPPDHFPLIFYRENCADMAIAPSDFSLETFREVKALLITGTHCSQDEAYQTTLYAIQLAKQARTQVILDIDYRPVLWGAVGHSMGEERKISHPKFSMYLLPLLHQCDLIVGTEEEIIAVVGEQNLDRAIRRIQELTPCPIVQKRGEKGCIVYAELAKTPIVGNPYPVKVFNVLGAGDAFMSGFLRGFLRKLSLEECCSLGNANGALVVTRHGCSPAMPFWDELQAFIQNPQDIEYVNHLHHILGRKHSKKEKCFLAFDHRSHFEFLAQRTQSSQNVISIFKEIIFEAFCEIHGQFSDLELGIITDDEYGESVIKKAAQKDIPVARCIEKAGHFPLKFQDDQESGLLLKAWPSDHIVKVLCFIEDGFMQEQLKTLQMLYETTKLMRHRLMIEFAFRKKSQTLIPIVKAIAECYVRRIYPEYWKLPPILDHESWKAIDRMVDQHDPLGCQILLLGENRPLNEITSVIQELKMSSASIKGFAVGRSIWGDVAEEWFQGALSSKEAKAQIAEKFKFLLKGKLTHDSSTEEENSLDLTKNRKLDDSSSPYTFSGSPTG